MSDGRPAPRPPDDGALPGFAALSAPARERALADVVAARANELAREARRVVRADDIAPVDRAAALDAVATVQRALLRDIATGRRVLDPRSWVPTLRTESERAVRRARTQQNLAVAPYRQRLAAQRAALLAVRQDAARGVPVAPVAAPPDLLPAGPATSTLAGPATSPAQGLLGPAPRGPAGSRGGARHVRGPSAPHAHDATARRTLRWGAAALLSSVTIMVGAAVAPAEERPAGADVSDLSFVDRLTSPLISLWDTIVPGKAQSPAVSDDAVPTQDAVEPAPVGSPTTPSPAPAIAPAPAPAPAPAAPAAPDKTSPAAPAVPVPSDGTTGAGVPPGHDGRRDRDGVEGHTHSRDGVEGRGDRRGEGRGEGREHEDDDDNGRGAWGGDGRHRDGHDTRSGGAGNDRDRWTRDQTDRARG